MDAEAVARRWIELYNDVEPGTYGTARVIDELYADGCHWREMPTVFYPAGRESDGGMDRSAMDTAAEYFIDRQALLQELVADGDRAAMRYEWSATIAGDFGPDMPPRGTRVRLQVAAFLHVRGGKIVDLTEVMSTPTHG